MMINKPSIWIFAAFIFICNHCSAPAIPKQSLIIGTFTIFNRDSPYLISAPHGEYDDNTGELVWEFCHQVRWDCMIVEGFRREKVPINVNRPTEGMRMAETQFTRRAAMVYARYIKKIRKLTPALRFYVEIHGNESEKNINRIEVATVGISPARARRIDRLLAGIMREEGLQLDLRIDVLEKIRYKATHARQFGVLSFLSPAIHIELPLSARTENRGKTIRVLVRALPELVKHEFPR